MRIEHPLAVLLPAAIAAMCWAPAWADPLAADNPKIKVASVVPLRACAFDLRDVRLLEGPFKRAMELDRQYLLSLDPERLLHNFRINAGLASSAEPLGGWEKPDCEVRGHFVGHYLSACAMMYASTGDAELKSRADYMVAELAKCQDAIRSGYLSAYPEEFIDRVEALKPVWAPYYTLHKIYAGLQDVYFYCDNSQALEVARRFGDWVIARTEKLAPEQMQAMLGNEHGGMNETLANLYGLTGQQKYLKAAGRFNHMAVIGPAAQREDRLTGLHANTQIPKFIGTARQYELTGEDWLRTASTYFWDVVVHERSYCIGGHSDNEHFSPKERLSQALGPNTTETCNTYNMLKLTRHLFCWEPKAEYADYYERALWNHILSSQDPATGMMCYYVPLRSGSRKGYSAPTDSFWCCTGTGIENHAKYGDSIYFHDGQKRLYVNLLIASELDWKARGVRIRQETRFPDEAAARLVFTCEKPVELELAIRHPAWAVSGMRVTFAGQPLGPESTPGSYRLVKRTWQTGDVVEIVLPMTLRTEGFRDNPRRLAFFCGPLVLCAEVKPPAPYPALVAEDLERLTRLEPVPGRPLCFTVPEEMVRLAGQEHPGSLTLEPFYAMHGGRPYAVYWDVYTAAGWQAEQERYLAELARRKELEARSVDWVEPGDREREKGHNLQGEHTGWGEFNGRRWRHATDGGWFSYDLEVLPDTPQDLLVTYWGSDGGNRLFDLLVDGQKLATERLQDNKPGEFYDQLYPLPETMLKGKKRITLRFQAHPGNWAGGQFGVRIVRRAAAEAPKK